MINTICLDGKYSTTRLLTKEKPEIIKKNEDKFESVPLLPKDEGRKGEGGLRTQGYFKKSFEDKPLISIITVVFNGKKYLEETIQSVINQSYDNVEYIIIDGGSTDGTLDIIKKYEDKIDYWISERDKGIYDAMNKGIDVASGEWINFMNAGDTFGDEKVLEKVFKLTVDEDIKCIYGDVLIDYGSFEVVKKSGNLDSLHRGMQFSHQSLFVNSNYHKQKKFDLSYNSAADYNFIYSVYVDRVKFLYKELIVSKITNGGISDIKRIQSLKESKRIVLSRNNILKNKLYFQLLLIKLYSIDVIKKIIPNSLIQYIQGKR